MDFDKRALAVLEDARSYTQRSRVEVAFLDHKHAPAWERYVESNAHSSLYHHLAWREVVHAAFGHETHYLYAQAAGRVTGVLPLVRLRSRLFGDFLVSLPHVNYGGVVADGGASADALMEAAARLATSIGSRHIEFRDMRRRDGWPVRNDKAIMELTLPASAEELWSRFDSKLRAQIRRAGKEGIQTVVGGPELLADFYAVFARNMRDLGTPVYAQRFFSTILGVFPKATAIIVCRYRGEAIAAGFLLRHRERLEIPWAASIRDYNRFGVNMALYWAALRYAIEQGCRVFDFGRSTVDSGTYRFKKQWGATPRPLFWHYWLGTGGELPQLTPNNPKYRLAIAAWQWMPLFAANRLGPALVKYLP